MALLSAQQRFALRIAQLITWGFANGYAITLGDAYRDPRVFGPIGTRIGYGSAASLHKLRLALDLNLFRDGAYLTDAASHAPLGAQWERLGGRWGGRFADPNHYELHVPQ
jgi:hypothetical protein